MAETEDARRTAKVLKAILDFQEKPVLERVRLALSASEAQELAAAEGLPLIRLPGSKTGFKGVVPAPPHDSCLRSSNGELRFKLQLGSVSHFLGSSSRLGTCRCLGTFCTAEEAALHYARFLGREMAVAEAKAMEACYKAICAKSAVGPLRAEEALRLAADEGLELEKTSRPSITGYRGVVRQRNGLFGAQHFDTKTRKTVWLGMFETAEEAALTYARYNAGTLVADKEAADASWSSSSLRTAGRRAQISARRAFAGVRGTAIKREVKRQRQDSAHDAHDAVPATTGARRKRAAAAHPETNTSRVLVEEPDEEERASRHTNESFASSNPLSLVGQAGDGAVDGAAQACKPHPSLC